jgi:outer membrane cobalamin receptor
VLAQGGAAAPEEPTVPAEQPVPEEDEFHEITVTTAGRREEQRSDAVVGTEVIERAQLVESGAENVAEALEDLPGIEIVPALQGTHGAHAGARPAAHAHLDRR